MINYVWSGLILVSLAVAVFTGRVEATTQAAFNGAADAVTMCISLLGTMCLWTGLIKIGEKSGLITHMSKLLRPLTRFLFPKLKEGSAALDAIVMNMVANMLGMANAATPLGLKAMKELSVLNRNSSTASDEMCLFVVINTASIQLVPSTLIALRHAANSSNPSEVIVPIWIASMCAVIVAVTAVKLFGRFGGLRPVRRRGRRDAAFHSV